MERVLAVDGGWVVPALRGSGIGTVRVEADAVRLFLGPDTIELRGPFEVVDEVGTHRQVPGERAGLGAVAALGGAVCRTVRIEPTGQLAVELADDRFVLAGPVSPFSAWVIELGGRPAAACRPGGGVDVDLGRDRPADR
ncbi:MAG: DUF6188 family protein [Acidimicrobiales bacterium]